MAVGDSQPATAITVDVEHIGDGAVITVGGELDFGSAAALRTPLLELAREGRNPVVVDLADLAFIDSSGLSLLVQAKQRLEAGGHRFELRNAPPAVRRVLEIAGLSALLGD
jgi:anti-anti-sigma factor